MLKLVIFLTTILVVFQSVVGTPKKVIVTGAAGRTGALVFQKLLQMPDYQPVGLVRNSKSAKKLLNLGGTEANIAVCDITKPDELKNLFQGAEKVILCTSAVPKIKFWSLIKSIFLKIFGIVYRPKFIFPKNGDPYKVDWIGSKNQIDAAKQCGVKQFVFLSSMGGTQPDNFLNSIGRKEGDSKSGNILLWKRKAEQYLISSGVPYTIIHPGGLLDKTGGVREIVFGVDDNLLKSSYRSIPREDVAEVCVQALQQPNAVNRAFDITSKDPGDGEVTEDWAKFFANEGNCKYNYKYN